jgi:hypothetical protein
MPWRRLTNNTMFSLIHMMVWLHAIAMNVVVPSYGFLHMIFTVRSWADVMNQEQARMKKPEVYQSIGHDLALYCQTTPNLMPTGFVGIAWLPPSTRFFSPNFNYLTPTNARIAVGGGFIERLYGYRLELDPEQPASGSNLWHLFFLGEAKDRLLHSFYMAASDSMPLSNYMANALAEYDHLAKAKDSLERGHGYPIHIQQQRINFLLQFDRTQVRDACVRSIEQMPNHFWPRLTLALIDARRGNEEAATRTFRNFIEARPAFSRYLYLAYYYRMINKPKDAVAAIEKALEYPIIELKDDQSNSTYRGYWAASDAFQFGAYRTTIKLVDGLLGAPRGRDYARDDLMALRTAAQEAEAGRKTEVKPPESMPGPFNPYEYVRLKDLLSR